MNPILRSYIDKFDIHPPRFSFKYYQLQGISNTKLSAEIKEYLDDIIYRGSLTDIHRLNALVSDITKYVGVRLFMITRAAMYGKLEIVKYIIPYVSIDEFSVLENYKPLKLAATNGHVDIVHTIIINMKLDKIGIYNSRALFSATLYGQLNVVKYLIEEGYGEYLVYEDFDAIKMARELGHTAVVEYLRGKQIHTY
jgi:hypothetical protein